MVWTHACVRVYTCARTASGASDTSHLSFELKVEGWALSPRQSTEAHTHAPLAPVGIFAHHLLLQRASKTHERMAHDTSLKQ